MISTPPPNEPRNRAPYYSGDAERPKVYSVWKCIRKGPLYIRNSGQKGERLGCDELNIVYSAKVWGRPKGVDWQAKCSCGKKTRLNTGDFPRVRIFETRIEAQKYIDDFKIQRSKEALIIAYANAHTPQAKNYAKVELRRFCKHHGLEYNREVYD